MPKNDELLLTVFEALDYIKNNPCEAAQMIDGIKEAVAVIAATSENNSKKETVQLPLYETGKSFIRLFEEIKKSTVDEIKSHIIKKYNLVDDRFKMIIEKYYKDYNFWGTLDIEKNDYNVFQNHAEALVNHADDFLWLYRRLADYRSRYILHAYVENWLNFNFEGLKKSLEKIFYDYFDTDIIKCGHNEVFVDLGAFNGDTVVNYITVYGESYKKIYCYEILPESFNALRENLKSLKNIELRQKGASDKKGVMFLSKSNILSANTLSEKPAEDSVEIETVALDEDITEPVTFIKMDIEGAEQAAVRGCARHIAKSKPKLAISLYHNNEDIWKIPRMIDEICPGYKFYLRYHGGELLVSELSLLAVHEE